MMNETNDVFTMEDEPIASVMQDMRKGSKWLSVLEKGVMSKWLAKQLQKDPATVSKWCNNHSQPDLYTFVRIANLLDVDVHELICHTKK